MNFILYPINNPIAFKVLNLEVRWYGLIITFAIFLGILISYKLVQKKYLKEKAEIYFDSIFPVVLFSIIGARFFYVIGDFEFYLKHPIEILFINHGGLSIYGAIFFGILTLFIHCKKNKLDFLKYTDVYALVMPLCQAIGRFGNYFNQEAYGKPTNSFIKLFVDKPFRKDCYIDIEYYHPTFLYESILNILSFFILFLIFLKFKNIKKGTITSLYLIFYSLIRILIEQIRLDSVLNVFNIPIATIISFVVLLVGITMFILIKKAPQK